jgi:hypothetical protein
MKTLLAIGLVAAVTATAGAVAPPPAAAPAAPPPKLDLVLKPHATGGADSYLAVRMTLEAPHLSAGDPLVHIPLKIVSIPTARYDGAALAAADAQGSLALTQEEEPPTPQGVYRRWKLTRATVGDVVLNYRAPPRVVTAATNNGPLFDLREEAGGFAGAGIGFLALPVDKAPHHVHLRWDLSDAPAGSRGEWSLADGDTELDIPAETLAFSYYAVGPLKSIPAQNDGKFGLYWLGEPNFDMSLLGERIRSLYATMSAFFGDTHSSYRVFVRQNPYEGHGGSALAKSFMFGYNPQEPQTIDKLQDLLAHEMTHNWPALEGEHGDTAWYTEGTAEYYSLLLSHRGGQLSTEHFLDSINERAAGYYSNPYLHLTNPEAARIFWSDPIAQTVPYGRGFLYLIITDAAIRAHSHGRRSLDDVVLELYRREQRSAPYGIAQWLELVGKELGADAARRGYDAMVSGSVQRPPASRFAPCLRVVEHPTRTFQLGFARASLNDDRIVRDVEAHSAAASAGVRNGDTIVDVKGMLEARKDETKPLILTVRRDGADTSISYLPRGEPTTGYAWVRNAAAPESSCKF